MVHGLETMRRLNDEASGAVEVSIKFAEGSNWLESLASSISKSLEKQKHELREFLEAARLSKDDVTSILATAHAKSKDLYSKYSKSDTYSDTVSAAIHLGAMNAIANVAESLGISLGDEEC